MLLSSSFRCVFEDFSSLYVSSAEKQPVTKPKRQSTTGFNLALGQALTALLETQGAGLGLSNLLGTLGSGAAVTQAVPSEATGLQTIYGTQANINPGVMGGYGSQTGMQGAYPNQQIRQGGSGRGQHGVGPYLGIISFKYD